MSGTDGGVIVWLRRDLRLSDHPSFALAAEAAQVIPVFIWSPEDEGDWATGSASRWWLYHSLARLNDSLMKLGSRLVIRRGPSVRALLDLQRETGARRVVWNEQPGAAFRQRDTDVTTALRAQGVTVEVQHGATLRPPGQVLTGEGNHYQVFTPFWRSSLKHKVATPLPVPKQLPSVPRTLKSLSLDELELIPRITWYKGMEASWEIGEAAAQAKLQRFVAEWVHGYDTQRDIPSVLGTSRLSPHLHFGEISPRQVWHTLLKLPGNGAETYRREIGWREFAYDLLFHQPQTADHPLRAEFADFPWRDDQDGLRRWQQGMTGYPIVDAGMRELWTTGWMHNRVRMIVASFLVKDLLIDWRQGARWFWDTLVDADLASNTLGWQWAGGCGADAAPFFRIFNPVLQSEKFDANGEYIKHWVPELKHLKGKALHAPWTSHGKLDYPKPVVDHSAARERALQAFDRLKRMRR